ncbi:PREDICTED: cysteine-rich and transmembrane domain-containing protein B-like isoform X2 [Ipomoea nil]|uniref:cysteine-rich and transmembrane domain-containing protein B-like isoform X2 n=1 Tax=Ipomoea nil TaxID=35883 RepID=UPI000900A446|nr:PREDICTED: cysteine-rich and transmembrane domain-containing protein B-like isoform X2 [Ipomoea nil]
MSQNPHQAPGTAAFPYSQQPQPQPQGGFSAPPPLPPPGYPVRDGQGRSEPSVPAQTQSRGDGFWKGCCAGLCCCCALEACF